MSSLQNGSVLTAPFPRWLLEAALEVCQTRGAVGRRSGTDVLVHTDLHFMNILATTTAERLSLRGDYLAIDPPQPQIGEAEFAVAPPSCGTASTTFRGPTRRPGCWSGAMTSAKRLDWTLRLPGNGASPERCKTLCGMPPSVLYLTAVTLPAPYGSPAPSPAAHWTPCHRPMISPDPGEAA